MNKLNKHEQDYIHVKKPNTKKIKSSLFGLVLLFFSFFSFKLLIYKWKDLDLDLDLLFNCKENCSHLINLYQLDIYFNLILTTTLILFGIIFTFNLFNKIDWNELFKILALVITIGLAAGLAVALTIGLAMGLVAGVTVGSMAGLMAGLITVLAAELGKEK